jgi:hypothetical protein
MPPVGTLSPFVNVYELVSAQPNRNGVRNALYPLNEKDKVVPVLTTPLDEQ